MTWTIDSAGDGYELAHSDGYRLSVDQLAPSRGTLYAWVELRWQPEEANGTRLVSAATRNLMGPTTASSLAGDAATALHVPKDRAQQILTDGVYEVITKHREGKPTVDLASVANVGFEWRLRPLLEAGGSTRLVAAGGSGKSFLVLAIGLAVGAGVEFMGVTPTTTGPVIYLDWETQDHGRTHGYRMRAVAAGMGVTLEEGMIVHQQHDLPLAERASSVAKLADKIGSPLIIVDSNTMARGNGGRAGFEAATTDLLAALRIIGRPALLIDHKSKEDIHKKRVGGYGSVHNQNQVRLEWEFTRVFPQGDDTQRVLLENTKQNNIPQQAPLAFEQEWHNDSSDPDRPRLEAVTFTAISAQLVRAVHPVGSTESESVAEQTVRWLHTHPDGKATYSEIGDALDVDRTTLVKAIRGDRRIIQAGKAGRSLVFGLAADAQPTLGEAEVSATTGEPLDAPW